LHGLSVHTLFSETPDNIIAIACFDVWICSIIPSPIPLPTTSSLSTITQQACQANNNKRKAGLNPEAAPSQQKVTIYINKCSQQYEDVDYVLTRLLWCLRYERNI